MPRSKQPEQHFPIRLTQAQRRAIAEVIPDLAGRLKLGERNQRTSAAQGRTPAAAG
jgi:hypothetical protein